MSRILELDMSTDHGSTHLIIGSNGSGKSSILNELLPYPPVKTSFGKSGFKSLELHHNNVSYKLTYDAGGAGHGFYAEEKNLNVSGTNEIQKELIKEHFGITSDVHMLLRCGLKICSLLPAQRKQVLMRLNPIDLDVFLDRYKKVHKDVVSYGNNLDRLYIRQKQLLEQRLPESQFKEMIELKSGLENQEKLLLVWLTQVSSELEKYKLPENSSTSIDKLTSDMRNLFRRLPKFASVRRTDHDKDIVRYKTLIDMVELELSDLEQKIQESVESLSKFEAQREILRADGMTSEEEIEDLLKKLDTFSFESNFYPTDSEDMHVVSDVISRISSVLVDLSYISYDRLYSKNELQNLYRQNADTRAKLSALNSDINLLSKQHDELIKSGRTYDLDDCKSNNCELRQAYERTLRTRQDNLDALFEKLTIAKQKFKATAEQYEADTETYNVQEKINEMVDKVLLMVDRQPKLRQNFCEEFILEKIRETPVLFIEDLNRYISKSLEFAEFSKLSERVRKLEEIRASQSSKKQVSIELLDRDINWHTKQLDQFRKTHDDKRNRRNEFNEAYNLLTSFSEFKVEAIDANNLAEEFTEQMVIRSNNEYLSKLYAIVSKLLTDVRSELIDITKISKEQEMLIVRLDTEVESVIAELKPKFESAKEIEKSLQSLPIEYTKSFVNSIIETANYFIGEVMTYQLSIVPYADDDVCDFTFPVLIDGEVKTKDISTCSDGQKAIIELAFNLAAIIELELTEFPVLFDEIDRALDTTHSRRLTDMLIGLSDKSILHQLFIVGHHTSMLDRFALSGDVTVLNSENIVLPESYNQHTKISYR